MIPEEIREKDLFQEWDELHLLMRRLGVAGTVRASFYLYNTPSEVRTFLQGIQNAIAVWSQLQMRVKSEKGG